MVRSRGALHSSFKILLVSVTKLGRPITLPDFSSSIHAAFNISFPSCLAEIIYCLILFFVSSSSFLHLIPTLLWSMHLRHCGLLAEVIAQLSTILTSFLGLALTPLLHQQASAPNSIGPVPFQILFSIGPPPILLPKLPTSIYTTDMHLSFSTF